MRSTISASCFGCSLRCSRHERAYRAKIASEGSLHLIGHREAKLLPLSAAFLRKLGQYVDSADVAGVDDKLLSKEDAEYLRTSGVLVLDSEVE